MFLVNVIPLTNIPRPQPQILTYFAGQKLPQRSLVLISLKKAKIPALVSSVSALSEKKMEVRKARFTLKPIDKILSKEPFLKKTQVTLALWLSQYYFCSLGIACKMMMPAYYLNKLKKQGPLGFSFKPRSSQAQRLVLFPTLWALEQAAQKYRKPLIVHSQLTPARFFQAWKKVYQGQAKTILGTRGAVFLPFENLKEIILYQEQSDNYKSWDASPKYDARKVGERLAKIHQCRLVFYAAAPSVVTFYQAQNKKINLNLEKPRKKTPPKIQFIKLSSEEKSLFPESLKKQISQYKKILLYLNRRGAAQSLVCQDCNLSISCPQCELPLAYHRLKPQYKLICHHCGYNQPTPSLCPQCQGHRLRTWGLGTQMLEEQSKKSFGQRKILRLDKDTASSLKKQKEILEEFQKAQSAILIATKMIFNLPRTKVSLVVAMNFDLDLSLPDYRASEQAFQTLKFLAGLAHQRLIIQTYNPQNPLYKYAFKRKLQEFYQRQIQLRRKFNLPPFATFIKLTFGHQNDKKGELEAKLLKQKLKNHLKILKLSNHYQILGPIPAFLPKIKGRHLWQLIVRAKQGFQKFTPQVLEIIPSNWDIDVDPLNLL